MGCYIHFRENFRVRAVTCASLQQDVEFGFDPLQLLSHNPLPWVPFVPIRKPAGATTEALPSTLECEFSATMAAGVFRYLNSLCFVIVHPIPKRMRCNGSS